MLNGVKDVLNKDQVFATRVDQPATVPDHPIKPNKALIVILAMMLGLMLGTGSAFVRNALKSNGNMNRGGCENG